MISMFSSASARRTASGRSRPLASGRFTRKNRVLVRVERNRAAVGVKVTLQGFEVRVRALAGYEAQLLEPARRIVDEHQQRTGSTAVLEPTMGAAIDLDQVAVARMPKAGLVETSALLARQPKPVGNHPSAKRLPTDLDGMLLHKSSVASVGSKSAYFHRTSSTAYSRTPEFHWRFEVRPRALWTSAPLRLPGTV
jgi:hypothetical protein